jgi:hypothetical protein
LVPFTYIRNPEPGGYAKTDIHKMLNGGASLRLQRDHAKDD